MTRTDSDVYACGLNSYGQLGIGDTDNRKRLTLVEDLTVSLFVFFCPSGGQAGRRVGFLSARVFSAFIPTFVFQVPVGIC